MLVLGFGHAGFLLLIRNSARCGAPIIVFSIPCFGIPTSLLDGALLSFSLSLKCLAHAESAPSACGMSCLRLSSTMLNTVDVSSSPTLHSLAQLDAQLSALNFFIPESLFLFRTFAYPDLVFFVYDAGRLKILLPALDFASVGASLVLHTPSCFGFALLIFGIS